MYKILVVDDEKLNINVLNDLLKTDYKVMAAINGQQALKAASSANKPDLILLDIMMPEMDGYEVCRRLKENADTKDIPVLFVTAMGETSDETKGLELGAADYLTKPISPSIVKARVKTQLTILQKNNDLVKAHEKSQQLIHILCHDLINPIGAGVTCLDVLEMAPDKTSKYLPQIKPLLENALEIISLTKDIMALDEGKKVVNVKPFNLLSMVNNSYNILSEKFKSKNISLNLKDIENSEIQVLVEGVSFLNSVLNNLFTNAVKFTSSEGEICVSVVEGENTIELTISDNGIGMSQELADSVFDTNKPTTRPGTNGEKGTGFGMPLVKKFVESYGGKISISSKELDKDSIDHGTKVKIILNKKI